MDFDKNKYKVWKLPHPMLIHWILNPGLAFNELILGQRIPKITLIDKTSDAPLMERQYVPCPHSTQFITVHCGLNKVGLKIGLVYSALIVKTLFRVFGI